MFRLDETKLLIDNAIDNIESSELLYNNKKYRNSITLAYYSMFLIAKALLITKKIYPKTHNGTIHEFTKIFVNEENFNKELAKEFVRTQNIREHASYGEIDDYSKEVAKNKIEIAHKFIKESEKFFK